MPSICLLRLRRSLSSSGDGSRLSSTPQMSARETRTLPLRRSSSKPGAGSHVGSRGRLSLSGRREGGVAAVQQILPMVRSAFDTKPTRAARLARARQALRALVWERPPRPSSVLHRVAVTVPVAWPYHALLETFFRFATPFCCGGLGPMSRATLKLPRDTPILDLACRKLCDHLFVEGNPAYYGHRLLAAVQDSWTSLNPALLAHAASRTSTDRGRAGGAGCRAGRGLL